VARTHKDSVTALTEWKPHLVVLDMDAAASSILDRLVGPTYNCDRLPVLALTRRGDLKTKLSAFERGVDEILTVPFCPGEFVARVVALMRRTYREPVAFLLLRLGALETTL
jgi:DNA-binding response OmpR family regulator